MPILVCYIFAVRRRRRATSPFFDAFDDFFHFILEQNRIKSEKMKTKEKQNQKYHTLGKNQGVIYWEFR